MFETIREIFSNREIALIIWTAFFITGVLIYSGSSKEFRILLRAFFVKSILLMFFWLFIYILLLGWLFYYIGIWSLKDFVLWILTVALFQIFSVTNTKEISHFWSIIKESIKLTVLFEFFVNFYSFGLGWELFFVPVVTLIALLHAVAETKEEYSKAKKIFGFSLGVLGWGVFTYSLYRTIVTPEQFFTLSTLKVFAFPILLTILYQPFLYIITLYMFYEQFFVNLEFRYAYQGKFKELQKEIRKIANFNLNKLNRIKINLDKHSVYDAPNLTEYLKIISQKT